MSASACNKQIKRVAKANETHVIDRFYLSILKY